MMSAIKALSYENHSQIKIKNSTNYLHAQNQQVVPLIVHEFSKASAEMPILFVKNAETGDFQAVALLGFKVNENLFYSEERWLGHYLPALISHHPFALMPSENDASQLQVFLKEDSHVISTTEGESLFDEQGNETDYMSKRKQAIGRYYEHSQVTQAFVNFLKEKQLLSQQNLTMDLNGEKIAINGVYLVDEKQLNALSDEDFLALRSRGFLSPIYHHLSSLNQLSKLAYLKTK